MKKAILIFLLAINITPAHADTYELRNADGSVENRIECTVEICGNPNSLYSISTLKPGQMYVRTDPNATFAKETHPYEIVIKKNEDKTYQIHHVEPIQITEDVRVLKKTERQLDPQFSSMPEKPNNPVTIATIEIDKKVETKTPEVIDELELWWANLLIVLTNLFAGWVWV